MSSILYKYRKLLTEGYNFTNADEVYNALEANQIGIKTQPEYKEKTKWGYACEKLRIFFKKCEELGIKDTTYGVQLLLSKVPPNNLENIIKTDGLYEFLKSRKKPWVKELKEYQTLMNDKVWLGATVNDLHTFEKAVQNNQSNHGKASKGSGNLQDVKVPYDDGTWKLLQPTSFQGEKAAAFYIKDGKETPTEWCTRADEHYYRRYTKDAPLYIIRNMKTGKSYQMAFEGGIGWDDERYAIVHFLDQNDVKGDEITQGDLSKIPNELLRHIPIPIGKAKGKTMAEYNTDEPLPDPNAGKKGYTDSKKAGWTKEVIVDKKIQRETLKGLDNALSREPHYYKKYADRDIVKIVSIDAGAPTESKNPLHQYVEKGKKQENKWKPKARKIKYYFLGHPESYVEIIASKTAKITPHANAATADGDDKIVLQYTGFSDMGVNVITDTGDIRGKAEYRDTKNAVAWHKKMKQVKEATERQLIGLLTVMKVKKFNGPSETFRQQLPKNAEFKSYSGGYDSDMPGRKMSIDFREDSELGKMYKIGISFVIPKGWSKEAMKIYNDYDMERVTDPRIKNLCWRLASTYNRNWRKIFQNEIIQNRAEGNYTENMYEEVNYFNY